jgi:hypothetical protein
MDVFPWGEEGTSLVDQDGPDTWQTEVLVTIGKCLDWEEALQIAISSGHGVGKGLGYDVEIPTPSGNRRWGDLKVGDKLFGQDGKPVTILQLHPYDKRRAYRITFDDGSFCETSGEHFWNVRGRQERRKKLDTWRTLDTIELASLGAKRRNGIAEARQWEIPIQGAAEFEVRALKVHPYFMGVWLGDGVKGTPAYGKPYQEVADKLESFGYKFGVVSSNGHRRALGVTHLFTDDVFRCGSHERYIPNDYKFNTIENRMRLFEGLCDTDGEVHHTGSIGYSSTSERLANDVIWLARSLGCKAQMQPNTKIGRYRNEYGEIIECRECWRVTINAPFNPFSIPHKKDAYKPSERRYLTRWIDSIEEIAPADGMCVTVSNEDGLYLANDFIVTHNSALVSWVILWGLSTRVGTKGVVTANTDNQLRTKTWVELGKWFQLAPILHDLFIMAGTSINARDEKWAQQWRFDRITWSEKSTEAFAGMHNKDKRIILIFDEASSIPDLIWEVSEGMKTDGNTEILWLVCGNPTRSIGRFKDCFTRFRESWRCKKVDARTAKMTNKKLYEGWVRAYGEDSDFVRVRVRGEFPRVGSLQFISDEIARAAAIREPISSIYDPLIMGVDVARFGDNSSVICFRRGRDARTIPWVKMNGVDTNTLSLKVIELFKKYQPDGVFVDSGGVGGGVCDRLRYAKLPIKDVVFGGTADGSNQGTEEGQVVYANKRTQMWGAMRDWLGSAPNPFGEMLPGGAIPNDIQLIDDLVNVQYGYTMLYGKDAIILEKKDDMRRRGVSSPDEGDALAITFAFPILKSDHTSQLKGKPSHQIDYNPYAECWETP